MNQIDIVQAASPSAPFVTIGAVAGLSAERALTGTSNQITVTDNGANSTVVLSTPQNLHTGATPTFASLTLSGLTISADADLTVGSASFASTFTKNDANVRTFPVVLIKPTFNTGGSNANTIIHVLDIDTVNTGVTGITATNLIRARSGASDRFVVNDIGEVDDFSNSQSMYRSTTYVTSTVGAKVNLRKARGTLAAPIRAKSADTLGAVQFWGAYAANDSDSPALFSTPSATIYSKATEDYTTTTLGGKLVFATTTIGANGTTDRATIDENGLTLANLTLGSILFAGTGGIVQQDNASLFWDDTNNRLGINTVAPTAKLTIWSNAASGNDQIGNLHSADATAGGSILFMKSRGTNAQLYRVQAADVLGGFNTKGYYSTVDNTTTGTLGATSGQFQFFAAETFVGSTNLGTIFRINLAPSGSGTVAETMRLTGEKVLKIAGSALRGTTEGTNHLDIFDGTAPVGTLANGCSLYSTSGEMRVMDAAGNATLLSPHDRETNEWIYESQHTVTGRRLRVDMERLMRALDAQLGGGFIHESFA